MRFSTTMEGLGVNLDRLGDDADRLPAGAGRAVRRHHGAAARRRTCRIRWSSSRSSGRSSARRCLALVGIKLPGLEFRNQRVEAAYRKELVYGEDDASRAAAADGRRAVRQRAAQLLPLYFHYVYFNVARICYLQTDKIFSYVILVPTIVAGKITLGVLQQISTPSARCAARSSISSIPGRRSSSCSRSTSACAPSRRRSRASRCRTSTGAIIERAGDRRRRCQPAADRHRSWRSPADAGRGGGAGGCVAREIVARS